jgi:guanylate kinase
MSPLVFTRPDHGVLFVISGPSGVGKSTLVKAAMARIPDLAFSVSATTRAPRAGETEGVEYHFVGKERFAALVAEDAFLEHATVYDRSYGTLRAPTDEALAAGRSLLLDIDVQGARQVRATKPDAVHVFFLPPSIDALRDRLVARGTDSSEIVTRRMEQVELQLQGCVDYDYVVVNDHLDTAHAVFQGVLLAELSRAGRRQTAIRAVLG